MIVSDRVKRAIAFYTAVIIFCILLPMMLSYALGYKIDFRNFNLKIYKTGIMYLASSPTGATIYINGRKHTDSTPARIEELKPGVYKIEVKLENFYPWEKDLVVRPNMVTRADHIILFPLTQDVKRIARYPVMEFAVSGRNYIYHMTDYGLFRSNMDGSDLKKISPYSKWPRKISGKKFSANEDRFLYFTEKDIFVVYLNPENNVVVGPESARVEEVLTTEHPIIDVFWYSDSAYIVVVMEKNISVVELRGEGARNVVPIYKFNSWPQDLYYDNANDSLYFTDIRKEEGLKEGSYLYRLDLRKSFFGRLMQLLMKKEEASTDERR